MKKKIIPVVVILFVMTMLSICIWDIIKFLEFRKLFHPLVEQKSDSSLLGMGISAIIIAPIIEEYFFRFPLRRIKNRNVLLFAYISSSILFGLIHIILYNWDMTHIRYIFIITSPQMFTGFVLGFIRLKYGFWYGVILHSLYNSLAIVWDLVIGFDNCFLCNF